MKKLSFFLMAMLVSLTSFAAALGEGYEKVTNISTLAAGDKVVLYCDDSSIGVTGVNGTKDAAVAATGWVEYLVEAATGGVKLKDTGASKYISLTTKNTFTYATTGSVCKVNANGLLCITLSGSDYFLYQNGTYYRMYVDKTGNSGYKPFYVYKVVPVEVDPDATMYTVTVKSADETMGTVTGGGEYAEGKTATLEASPKAGYEFVKWSNGSTENPLKLTVTEDIELTATFQAQTPITIAEANQLKDAAKCILKEFTVAYIYKSYIHIQDASGYGMIYAGSFGLKAGDVVTGFTCSKSTYNGLPQFTPTCKLADLTVVAGEAPAVAELTTAPTGNYHQVVKLMNLTMTGSFNTSSNTTVKATCPDGTTIDIFNGKNHTYTFVAGKTYNITGDVCQYSGKIQVSTYAIEEYVAPVVNHTIAVSANPAEAGTVTGAGEYEEGTEATLTATANEGYEFTCWTSGEDTVSTANPYTFAVTANVALVANFKAVEPTTITYELNGGEFPAVVVPTNEELAMAFKQEYAEYFAIEGLTDTDMNREVGNFIYVTNSKGGDAVKFITENANWKWLADYIISVAAAIPEGTNVGYYWRANIDAFFHCKNAVAVGGVNSADFSEAGKPENWGAAYEAAHEVVLPTEPVAEDYVLPTPVKEGYTFVGWYDNAEGTGKAYTVIPAGWSGTLYAIWKQSPTTALDNIAIEGKVVKTIINGQLIIINNGVQYNALGQVIR